MPHPGLEPGPSDPESSALTTGPLTPHYPSRHLTRRDFAMNQHGLIVTFKCTKTIQFRGRKSHIPLLRLPGSPLCPASAYHRMIRLVPASS